VLITDGLSTAATTPERIRMFEVATKTLKPRIPVHTVLLPLLPGEAAAAGLYWELANATRGALTTVSSTTAAPRTHLAFIIDTSGSMRDPNTGGLWPIVIKKIEETLDAHPNLAGLQLLDGDGRFILPRRGTGSAGWNPDTPETRERIKDVLRTYKQDTVSNPVPGVYNALRFLDDKDASDMRIGIYLFGDEFNSSDPASVAIQRLDKLNPRAADGQRRIVINAIGFPTTIRYQFAMGNTGLRFADLMRTITHEHGGTFMALQGL
jgi:hypothetical protein